MSTKCNEINIRDPYILPYNGKYYTDLCKSVV